VCDPAAMKKSRAKPPQKVQKTPQPTPQAAPGDEHQAVEVRRISLQDLHADPANARMHNDKNLRSITDSLKAFGQVENLVVQKSSGKVIGGNGRLEAMREMGWTHADVAMVDLSDAQATALGIALNRTAELASWDVEVLGKLTDSLRDQEFDLSALGFDDADLKDLARKIEAELGDEHGDQDADDVPDTPTEATTRLGDIWSLGDHRLICGDSKLLSTFEALCEGQKCDAVITDPPYGLDYVGKTKDALTIKNDGKEGLLELLDLALSNCFTVSQEGAVWYVWAPAGPQFLDFAQILKGLKIWRQTLVWVKDSLVMGHSDYHYRHEVCFYGWREGKHLSTPDRCQDTVWEVPRPKRSTEHPTMKPVELIERCVKNSTIKGQLVLEPFSGSGTTLIACEQLGRRCFAVEIDPRFCDVALRRWSKLTGKDPVLLSNRDDGEGPALIAVAGVQASS
jgi:DNA modification methylase